MRIAVMAGTPMDTKLGVDLLNKNGFDQTISVPISKNPIEQTTFQALEDEEREQYIRSVIDGLDKQLVRGIGKEDIATFLAVAEKIRMNIEQERRKKEEKG